MLRTTFSLIALLLSLSACRATPPAPQPVLPRGEHIGEPIEPREIVTFSNVHANPSAYFEKTVLVEANATAVCQRAGCWMQIEDDGDEAMVRWESGCGGKYAFPKDLAGERVLVQGSFYPKTISEEDAAHLEEEAGEPLEVERDGYEFNASAVLVIAKSE